MNTGMEREGPPRGVPRGPRRREVMARLEREGRLRSRRGGADPRLRLVPPRSAGRARWRPGRRAHRLAAAAAIIAVALVAWAGSPYFLIAGVTVEGAVTLSPADVQKAAGIGVGRNIWRLSAARAAARLRELPVVRDARITRVWPNRVHIAISERLPLAAAPFFDQYLIVDADGHAIAMVPAVPPGLPVITGVDLARARLGAVLPSDEAVLAAQTLAAFTPEALRLVSEVHVEGGEATVYTTQGIPVYLGPPGPDTEKKARLLPGILADLQAQRLKAEYIDLRPAAAPVVKVGGR